MNYLVLLGIGLLQWWVRPPKAPSAPVQVVHQSPGRLRLALPGLKRQPAAIARAERALGTLFGVTQVSGNPWTGRLLLHFDPTMTTASWLTIQVELWWDAERATAHPEQRPPR